MKNLSYFAGILLLLSSCNSGTAKSEATATVPVSPEQLYQEKISAFIKTNADDPASYQPVRFGKPVAYRQDDVNALEAESMAAKAKISVEYLKQSADREVRMTRMGATPAQIKPITEHFNQLEAEVKHFHRLEDSLRTVNDTTFLGTTMMHAFRSKNKMGALVLDSARFLIAKDGKVSVL